MYNFVALSGKGRENVCIPGSSLDSIPTDAKTALLASGFLKKVADQAVVEAIATETANVIQMEPLSFNTSDKGFRKSQFQNQPKFRLRPWVWRRTKLEVEAAFMLLLLGTGVLAAVWVAIDQI